MTPDTEALAGMRALLRPVVRQLVEEVIAELMPPGGRAEGYFSTSQVAQRLGVEPDTILAWIAKGRLRASKLPGGRDWRVKPADLEAALASTGKADQDPLLSHRGPVDLQARVRSLTDAARRKGPRR